MKILFRFLPAFLILWLFSCDSKGPSVVFNYDAIMYKEFRFNIGKTTPITINRSIETDGDISADGKYFFYTSNEESGNFDIYLRSMNDITTVRVTEHPSKDISPVISPDGKKLAFVSYRTDPEGDIFVMDISPEELLNKTKSAITLPSVLDTKAKLLNLTEQKTPSGVVKNIKDYSPAWSRDGKYIAYTSEDGGESNIWIMDSTGSGKKKLTKTGGVYPSFSTDGSSILFISYRDSQNGEVYSMDLKTGKEKRLTADTSIKLYPSFAGNNIIYTSIESDTNGNKRLDLNDRAIIRFKNLKKNVSYPLTRKSTSSLKAKWLPVLKTPDFNGVLIYSSLENNNINLNLLPETGIIPKKVNAKLQYELCERFINEFEDSERYIMSLEAVYHYYGDDKKINSSIYVDRALGDAVNYYKENKLTDNEKFISGILSKRVENGDRYAQIILDHGAGKSVSAQISAIKKYSSEKFAPFAVEDMGDILFAKKDYSGAKKIYMSILSDYPEYERVLDIHNKINFCSKISFNSKPSDSFFTILEKGKYNQKISLIKFIAGDYVYNTRNAAFSVEGLKKLKSEYGSNKNIYPMIGLSLGIMFMKSGETKKAINELQNVIKIVHPNELTYYYSTVILGEYYKTNNPDYADSFFYNSIDKYSRRFSDPKLKGRILYVTDRYNSRGLKQFEEKNFMKAVETFKTYRTLLDGIYSKRIYVDIYDRFSPEVQIRYIDAYIALHGEKGIENLVKTGEKMQDIYRNGFNKPYLYGLAYIYALKGMDSYNKSGKSDDYSKLKETLEYFKKSLAQLEWCIFIDDTFIDPYLMKTWIYQFVDRQRSVSDGRYNSLISEYFPEELFEENIEILKKALAANDEISRPENEGNIHLNMANNYFLLSNYTRALDSYRLVEKYKKQFNNPAERALFHFHYSYSLWQNGEIGQARNEMVRANTIYQGTLKKGSEGARSQLVFMKYFALFSRYNGEYEDAIFWYTKIMDLSKKYGIKTDSARILQELAYCYHKTENDKKALELIAESNRLLKDYPDDKKKYSTVLKLFGFLPFFSWDLGPDAIVIGNNKIFYPLDRDSKKLLNLSMEEEIALRNGKLDQAISILKRKVDSISDSTSTSVETKIRSLNNIGFYYFRNGDISNSEKYFTLARKTAFEAGNLQGIFMTTLNLVNLYSSLHENGKNETLSIKTLETLSSDIQKYRNEYEDSTFKAKYKDLRDEAEAKKRKITEQETEALRLSVKESSTRIYYRLDTALATLLFLRAEIISISSSGSEKPADRYSANSTIFRLYSEAARLFEASFSPAGTDGQTGMQAKLLLNMSACSEKLGDIEKAYEILVDAEDLSVKSGLKWEAVLSKIRMAIFMERHGSALALSVSSGESLRVMKEAADVIIKSPSEYKKRKNRIAALYGDFAELAESMGKSKTTSGILELRDKITAALK